MPPPSACPKTALCFRVTCHRPCTGTHLVGAWHQHDRAPPYTPHTKPSSCLLQCSGLNHIGKQPKSLGSVPVCIMKVHVLWGGKEVRLQVQVGRWEFYSNSCCSPAVWVQWCSSPNIHLFPFWGRDCLPHLGWSMWSKVYWEEAEASVTASPCWKYMHLCWQCSKEQLCPWKHPHENTTRCSCKSEGKLWARKGCTNSALLSFAAASPILLLAPSQAACL